MMLRLIATDFTPIGAIAGICSKSFMGMLAVFAEFERDILNFVRVGKIVFAIKYAWRDVPKNGIPI